MLLVIRLIRDIGGDDDLGPGIHGGLAVVALDETALGPGDRHDAALGIGEVPLGLRVGHRAEGLRWPASARPGGLACIEHLLLQGGRRLGLVLQDRLGGPNGLKPLLPPSQLSRPFIATPSRPIQGIIADIGRLRLLEQRRHFGLQPDLLLDHTVIAHGLVLGGIGLQLGPIQRHMPQRDQASPLTERQHLHEQIGQGRQMLLAKVADGPKIWPLVGRQHAKGHVLFQFPSNLPRGWNPHGIGIEQDLDQHPRMVRHSTTGDAPIGPQNRGEIQLFHEIGQEIGQMRLG